MGRPIKVHIPSFVHEDLVEFNTSEIPRRSASAVVHDLARHLVSTLGRPKPVPPLPPVPTTLEDPMTENSTLLDHCNLVYGAMSKHAQTIEDQQVFVGSLTALFQSDEIGLGIPQYSHVMRKLKAMDCVRQLHRGAGGQPSRWLLLQSPTPELFQLPDAFTTRVPSSRGGKAIAEQQNKDLNNRLGRLEEWARTKGYQF